MRCDPPSGPTRATPAQGDAIEADTPGSDGTRLFARDRTFTLAFTTRATQDDTVEWKVRDDWNVVRASGRFAVKEGAQRVTLKCASTLAGYFALSAKLAETGSDLSARGTRPAGIATFGVLPDVSSVLPAVDFAHEDDHRFGGQGTNYIAPGQTCCDGDGYRPLYPDLGLAWANDNRNWHVMEPKRPNAFVPGVDTLAPYFRKGDIMRLIQVDGLPAWASPTGTETHSYMPASEAAYRSYISRVGTDSALIRTTYFPRQSHNYYQVTWEPDPESGFPWRDTDERFVALYRA
ncbi:MAG TPA: hypothetical protein VGZ01_06935, partial [Trinickia sp.]|nr:hypothetical protein [Trinickia sp.]